MQKNPILITGATGSMGVEATRTMAAEGYPIIMACRNLVKGEAARQQILQQLPQAQLELMQLDLSSQASVRDFVSRLQGRTLSGLFNNAGIISRDYSVTVDGLEHSMAVNYLNPALLTRLLVPNLERGAHVVNMVSLTVRFAHMDMEWPTWGAERFHQLPTYSNSKLAFLYFSIAFARKNPQLIVNVSDPGIVNSNMISMGRWFDPLADIFFRPFIKTPKQGVQPALRALHTEDRMRYFVGKKSDPIPARYTESPLIDPLWEQGTQMLGL